MSSSLLRVALTGGIATGKSYCLSRFAKLGLPVIDADQLARDLVMTGSPILDAVVARFGPTVRGAGGHLDRRALAAIVFTDTAARSDLEALLHPAVYARIEAWFESLSSSSNIAASGVPPPLAVAAALEDSLSRRPRALAMADIPLLYETGREGDFDRVVVAACRPDQQLERMLQRGYSRIDATARLAAQLPLAEKIRRADHVIDTSGTTDDTDRQVDRVYGELVSFRSNDE